MSFAPLAQAFTFELAGGTRPVVAMQPIFLALALLASSADEIDGYVRAVMEERRIPGLAFAVVRDGEVLIKRAYGLANLETNTPVETDSVFDIASLTKPLTATAVMMLVEEGKVDLDASVVEYVDDAPEAWEAILVRHLLSHNSGLPEQVIPSHAGSALMDVEKELMLRLIKEESLLFSPGEGTQ